MSMTSLYRRNVGGFDRGVRLLLGVALVAAGLFFARGISGASLGIFVAVVGLVGLLSGITGRCPLYALLGISTAHLATDRLRVSTREPKEQCSLCSAPDQAHLR
jgi:hypothetical protein